MNDQRVRVVRFWFAAFYAGLLLWLFPHQLSILALIPLALFMPVIDATSPCIRCNGGTQTDEIEATYTNIIDDACSDCANMNRTIIIAHIGSCSYQTSVSVATCGASTLTARFSWNSDVGGSFLSDYSLNVLFDAQVVWWAPAFSVPRDCSAAADLIGITADGSSAAGTSHCDFSSAQGTFTPTGSFL